MKALHKLYLIVLIVAIAAALLIPLTATPTVAGNAASSDACTTRPDNMTRNGSVTDGGHPTQYGVVANEWQPFILSGSPPAYDLADNESANGDISGSSSQYIHGDGIQFDAGIYQTVSGTQPGAYYEFSVGWAAMLRDIGGGQNKKIEGVVGRMVGVDPTGGTDPRAPSVIMGQDLWTGSSGQSLNSPVMKIVFAAQSDHVTVFVRAHNVGAAPSDKVFLDVICLLPRGDMPTATPAATSTPSPTPTNAPRIVAQAANAAPVVTRIPSKTPKPADTATPVPTDTPTITFTPTKTAVPTETPKPRRAIPLAGAAVDPGGNSDSSSESDSTSEQSGTDSTGVVVLVGSVGLIGFSGVGILALGAFVLFRVIRRPGQSQIRYY